MPGVVSRSYQPAKSSVDEWNTFEAIGRDYALARVPIHWIPDIAEMTHSEISQSAATVETMLRVQKRNSLSFWGLFRRSPAGHVLDSYYGQLLLNEMGHRALLAYSMDRSCPADAFLCDENELPSAIHLWCVVAKGNSALLQPLLRERMKTLVNLPHYATLATDAGIKIGRRLGLKPVVEGQDGLGALFRLPPNFRVTPKREGIAQEDSIYAAQ